LDNPNPNPNTGDGDGGDGGGGACGHEHGHRVWVPLCGKSVDVTWLAVSGHRVLGVELSGVAIDLLFPDFRLPRTTWQPPAPRDRQHESQQYLSQISGRTLLAY
jgi:hypothetical protein